MNERSATVTERLYEADSHLFTFTATVLSCDPTEGGYAVILDRTAFFPTGGGQPCDTGTLDGIPVTDVAIVGAAVIHTLSYPLPVGATICGRIREGERRSRMAAHSGEHLLSAVLFTRHGLQNIGFHLGSQEVTCDFDGVIDDTALVAAEEEVNRLIRENHPIIAYYPAPETLAVLSYRSKLSLTEGVRIVAIGKEGKIDRCACCAPHVAYTGEIGLMRIVAREHYKGGLRLHLLCGAVALARAREDAACVTALSNLLSAKPNGPAVTEAVGRLSEELRRRKEEASALHDALNRAVCRTLIPGQTPQLLFDERDDAVVLRRLAVEAAEAVGGTVMVCGGTPLCRFVCCGKDAKSMFSALKASLGLRGGGSDTLVCGSLSVTREAVATAFAALSEAE